MQGGDAHTVSVGEERDWLGLDGRVAVEVVGDGALIARVRGVSWLCRFCHIWFLLGYFTTESGGAFSVNCILLMQGLLDIMNWATVFFLSWNLPIKSLQTKYTASLLN